MSKRGNGRRRCWRLTWWLGAVLAPCWAWAAAAKAAPFVYVVNEFSPSVSQYDATTGALSALTPPMVAVVGANSFPIEAAISPDGKSVYVTNGFGNTVSQYDVGPAGALTPKVPATVAAGTDPEGVAVSPDGKSAYVVNAGGFPPVTGTVSQYDIDRRTGALSPKTPPTESAGASPFGVAVSPLGKSVYVTNFNNFVMVNPGTVSQFDVGAGGALTPKTPATVATGLGPLGIAVTPLPVPTSKDQCKNGGWRTFPQFKNQGDCVSFVENGK